MPTSHRDSVVVLSNMTLAHALVMRKIFKNRKHCHRILMLHFEFSSSSTPNIALLKILNPHTKADILTLKLAHITSVYTVVWLMFKFFSVVYTKNTSGPELSSPSFLGNP